MSRKFKAKDSDTVYTLSPLKDEYHDLTWVNSSGESRKDERHMSHVINMFNKGDWYFIDEEPPIIIVKPDAVNHPKHYAVFEQLEAIEVIASSMTTEQFYGYCLGNILKYRLRAGGKDDVMQELGKADKYQELFTQFKSLCKDAV